MKHLFFFLKSQSVLLSILLFITSLNTSGQASIGQTEEEIRAEYKSNPHASISEEYGSGEKNIIVVDKDATASFCINNSTKLCYRSAFQFRNLSILQDMITKFNSRYEVIIQGKAWKTMLKGHEIKMELRYSDKLQSSLLIAYLIN